MICFFDALLFASGKTIEETAKAIRKGRSIEKRYLNAIKRIAKTESAQKIIAARRSHFLCVLLSIFVPHFRYIIIIREFMENISIN